MHLSEVGPARVFLNEIAVLCNFAQMGIPLNSETREQSDGALRQLAEAVYRVQDTAFTRGFIPMISRDPRTNLT